MFKLEALIISRPGACQKEICVSGWRPTCLLCSNIGGTYICIIIPTGACQKEMHVSGWRPTCLLCSNIEGLIIIPTGACQRRKFMWVREGPRASYDLNQWKATYAGELLTISILSLTSAPSTQRRVYEFNVCPIHSAVCTSLTSAPSTVPCVWV